MGIYFNHHIYISIYFKHHTTKIYEMKIANEEDENSKWFIQHDKEQKKKNKMSYSTNMFAYFLSIFHLTSNFESFFFTSSQVSFLATKHWDKTGGIINCGEDTFIGSVDMDESAHIFLMLCNLETQAGLSELCYRL